MSATERRENALAQRVDHIIAGNERDFRPPLAPAETAASSIAHRSIGNRIMPLATVGIGGTTGDDDAGVGRIVLDLHGNRATFSALSYRYPLKILSPRIHEPAVAIAYLLTYGGGLVSGDCIRLSISVAPETCLLLLTQACALVLFFTSSLKRPSGLNQGLQAQILEKI